MIDELREIVEKIKNDKTILIFNEANTRIKIREILHVLGWDIFNPSEVINEYDNEAGKVDIVLNLEDDKKIFIEAKKAGLQLQQEHQKQLAKYVDAASDNVVMSILTNSIRWWFYLTDKDGIAKDRSFEQKKFCLIDIENQGVQEIVEKFVYYLLKENVKNGQTKELAEEVHKGQKEILKIKEDTISVAWNKIIKEIRDELVDLIAETTESICGYKPDVEMIEKFMGENKVQFSIPGIVPDEPEDYTGKTIRAFYFINQKYYVNKWKEFLVQLANILYVNHSKDFYSKLENFGGRRHKFFSHDKNDHNSPEKIGGSDIYVETAFGANYTVDLCERLVEIFGYSKNVLRIDSYKRT